MVHFGRAEIVTVTLLCNKPACRKTPESGVDHKLDSRLSFFISLFFFFFVLLIHGAVKLRFPIGLYKRRLLIGLCLFQIESCVSSFLSGFWEITKIDGQRYREKI